MLHVIDPNGQRQDVVVDEPATRANIQAAIDTGKLNNKSVCLYDNPPTVCYAQYWNVNGQDVETLWFDDNIPPTPTPTPPAV